MQAHIACGVVVDIAAFKISHSSEIDEDATALRAARARSSSKGAMEKTSRKVQKVSTYPVCGIGINAGVGQRCRAQDVESSALQATTAKRVTFHQGDG